MGVNERLRAQARPVWGSETSEQLTDVSNLGTTGLTIPSGCTGITVSSRDPANATALYILPTGNNIAGPRIVLDGGGSARRSFYMAIGPTPPDLFLLAENAAGADADIFYHFD